MQDLYGRNINYLRLSITDLCNLRCQYCMPVKGIKKSDHNKILTYEEIVKLAKVFIETGIDKIRITGGEPLSRNDVLKLINGIGKLEKLKDFALTTNGLLLAKYANSLKLGGLNRVNISLDTLDDKKFSYITRTGTLSRVLSGIDEAEKAGLLPIKINCVLIGGFNTDEIADLVGLTVNRDISVRFIELMPVGEASSWAEEKFVSNTMVLDKMPELVPETSKDISSPATYYKLPGAIGSVGLISPISCRFCSTCNRVRLTSNGKLKFCLHSDEEVNLRDPLRENKDIKKLILESIAKKPEAHHLESGEYIAQNMVQIGG